KLRSCRDRSVRRGSQRLMSDHVMCASVVLRKDPRKRDNGSRCMKQVAGTALAAWCLLAVACVHAQALERLRALGADVSAISVSGVSSGGYMAVQFHVAYSAVVRGAGVLAAG